MKRACRCCFFVTFMADAFEEKKVIMRIKFPISGPIREENEYKIKALIISSEEVGV